MQTRAARLILNVIFSVLSWLVPVTLGLLVTPFLLARLGVETYGLYLVILGFIAYSFTFNVNRSVVKYVAEFNATGDAERANSVITAAFVLSLIVGIAGMLLIALTAGWVVTELLQLSEGYHRSATVGLMIGGASIPFILVGQLFQNVLQGRHRFGVLSLVTNANWFLLNAGNLILVVWGYGIDALFGWTVVVAAMIAGLSFLSARRLEPEYRIRFKSVTQMLGPVLSFSSSVILYQIFGSVLLVFERVWLTRRFGADAASYYLVPMSLAMYFHGLMSSLSAAVFPVFNELADDKEKSKELYRKMSKVLVSLGALFFLSVLFGGNAFLSAWIGPGFTANSYSIMLIHSITFGLLAMFIATWQVNETFGAPAINAVIAGTWAIAAISIMTQLAQGWNAEGVALARLSGVAFTLPIIFFVERRFFGSVQLNFWGGTISKIGVASAVLAAVEYPLFYYFGGGWLGIAGAWALGSAAYLAVLYRMGVFSAEEKRALLQALGFRSANVQ